MALRWCAQRICEPFFLCIVRGFSPWEVLYQRYHRPLGGSGGFEGLPLDFDAAEFYRRFDSFSKNGRQMMEAGRDHGAIVLG
jgi:hypothetical protein